MNVKLAIAPIGWSNDDMPELGEHISFEQCIQEMALAGFEGCEVGHKFPRNPSLLRAALFPYQLRIASAWYSLYFTENRTEETLQGFITHMHFLKAMGANVIVVCECGQSIQSKQLSIFAKKPIFTQHEWQLLIAGLEKIGHLARQNEMAIVYHPHMGTGVQQQTEIDFLMQQTSPDHVSLVLDTGHLYFASEDPLVTLQKHASRIKHVHLKDIRATVLEKVKSQHLSFLDAVRAGVFTVPGDGCIPFADIFTSLQKMHYEGWWVVEAEQDPEKAIPLEYAQKAREFLRNNTGL